MHASTAPYSGNQATICGVKRHASAKSLATATPGAQRLSETARRLLRSNSEAKYFGASSSLTQGNGNPHSLRGSDSIAAMPNIDTFRPWMQRHPGYEYYVTHGQKEFERCNKRCDIRLQPLTCKARSWYSSMGLDTFCKSRLSDISRPSTERDEYYNLFLNVVDIYTIQEKILAASKTFYKDSSRQSFQINVRS